MDIELAISIFVTKTKESYKRSFLDTKGNPTPKAICVTYFHVVSLLLNTNEEVSRETKLTQISKA